MLFQIYFCNYFSRSQFNSTTVELESPESLFCSYKDYLPPSENSSMFLAPVTFGEFQKVIMNSKSCNSLGLDGLSTNILKDLACVIDAPLLHILNVSISSGIFPEAWKSARVILIHKKGDKRYRQLSPIAILFPISKVLEKIIRKRIVSYFGKRNLFTKNQFGFRSGHSTEQAIAAPILEINDSLNDDNHVSALFYEKKGI